MIKRVIYGPDGEPISSHKVAPIAPPPRVTPETPQFRAMQKTLHLSTNQMRGAIRRSTRVAQRDRAKSQNASLDSVHRAQQQASRDEAKRLKVERQKSRGEVK